MIDKLIQDCKKTSCHVEKVAVKMKNPGLLNSKSFEEFCKSQKSKIDLFNDIYLLDFVAVVFLINLKLKVEKYL